MTRPRRHIPSMNALFAFEAAGRLRNFSRAAETLNVTPAAVSRMMQRLEKHIGAALFRRAGPGISLSAEGQVLFDATSRAMSLIDAALVEIEGRTKSADTVTISVSTAFTTHWLMPRMSQFKAAFPNVDLRFQLMMGPLTGPVDDVDLGMRYTAGPVAGHRVHRIMPEVLLPVCSPGYLKRGTTGEDTVIKLSAGQPLGLHEPLENIREAANTLLFSDYAIVVQAALLGQGVCWGWMNVVSHRLAEGQLIAATDAKCHVAGRVCCILELDRRPVRPIVQSVRDWLIKHMREDYASVTQSFPHLGIPELGS